MVSSHDGFLNVLLTSTGPTIPTENNIIQQPSSMDLAMKFHYLRLLYFFNSIPNNTLPSILQIKEATHKWLNLFPFLCGRFKRSDTDRRPFLLCNDSGVRFMEAKCSTPIHHWLHTSGLNNSLCPLQTIGPDLPFSPPLLVQVTSFKCGAISIGFCCALVLADPFSISALINHLGHFLSSSCKPTPPPPLIPSRFVPNNPVFTHGKHHPLSLGKVGRLSECWVKEPGCEMETMVFHLKEKELRWLHQRIHGGSEEMNRGLYFGSVCALFWREVGKVRGGGEVRRVTVCRGDSGGVKKGQKVWVVRAEKEVDSCELWELESLVMGGGVEEVGGIERAVEEDCGGWDFIVYGHNLTFVDMEEVDLYGFEVEGEKAVRVDCGMDGVGESGVVLVLPAPGEGRIVSLNVPVKEAACVKRNVEELFRKALME